MHSYGTRPATALSRAQTAPDHSPPPAHPFHSQQCQSTTPAPTHQATAARGRLLAQPPQPSTGFCARFASGLRAYIARLGHFVLKTGFPAGGPALAGRRSGPVELTAARDRAGSMSASVRRTKRHFPTALLVRRRARRQSRRAVFFIGGGDPGADHADRMRRSPPIEPQRHCRADGASSSPKTPTARMPRPSGDRRARQRPRQRLRIRHRAAAATVEARPGDTPLKLLARMRGRPRGRAGGGRARLSAVWDPRDLRPGQKAAVLVAVRPAAELSPRAWRRIATSSSPATTPAASSPRTRTAPDQRGARPGHRHDPTSLPQAAGRAGVPTPACSAR